MSLFDKSKKFLISSLCVVAFSVAIVGCQKNDAGNNGNNGDSASKTEVKHPSGNLDLVAPAGAGGLLGPVPGLAGRRR